MTLIEWQSSFSIGVADIDAEHRDLIELVNWLGVLAAAGGSSEKVVETLGEIYAQIAAHFALEEQLMRTAGYDEFAGHKADHEALLDELRDIMDQVDDDGRYDSDRLSRRMQRWFAVHFSTHDARLHGKLNMR